MDEGRKDGIMNEVGMNEGRKKERKEGSVLFNL